MSDTTNDTPQPEPQPSPSAEPQPADEAQRQQPEAEPQKSPEETNWERRVNRLTSRVSTVSRENDELRQRLAAFEQAQAQHATGQQPPPPELQQYIRTEAERLAQAQRIEERRQSFNEQGAAAYPDWEERKQSLIAMGVDIPLSVLLVEMPDGARIAGELHDNPAELERIAEIRSERGRAVALGQFAAKLEQRPRTVSRAPRPPQPVTGRVNPQFNEYNASAQDLVAFYTKRAQEQQRR